MKQKILSFKKVTPILSFCFFFMREMWHKVWNHFSASWSNSSIELEIYRRVNIRLFIYYSEFNENWKTRKKNPSTRDDMVFIYHLIIKISKCLFSFVNFNFDKNEVSSWKDLVPLWTRTLSRSPFLAKYYSTFSTALESYVKKIINWGKGEQ